MSDRRTHFCTTTDGVTIGGTVYGQGPSIVFLHGGFGDGDLDWGRTLEHLAARFTCYLPSMRGRGLSGDHPDLGPGRHVEDVLAYLDSIATPAGLVGWSAGATLALSAAARSRTVSAVAVYEFPMRSAMNEVERAVIGEAIARLDGLAAAGDMTAAVRAFADGAFSSSELAAADDIGYFTAAGRYVPNLLAQIRRAVTAAGPTADDPALIGAISAPALVLYGSDTMDFYRAGARHLADHIPDVRVQEIRGAGHAAPLTHPAALAAALAEFFAPDR